MPVPGKMRVENNSANIGRVAFATGDKVGLVRVVKRNLGEGVSAL